MISRLIIIIALAISTAAYGQQSKQETFYDAQGRVSGRAATDSGGQTTFYDASGRVVGKSTAAKR